MKGGSKDMDTSVLHRYFEGHASLEEEHYIQQWLESSPSNFDLFMQERKAYDMSLMHTETIRSFAVRRKYNRPMWVGVAASLLILIISSLLYVWYVGPTPVGPYHTIVVPAGQRVEVVLSDSTKVWLHALSKLSYPSNFGEDGMRRVTLEGEGYFSVSKKEGQRFVVHTGIADVEVTGTEFNVKTHASRSIFEVSLFEGAVNIYREDKKILALRPNQRIRYVDHKFEIGAIDNDTDGYLWREGLIAFKDASIPSILAVFEDVYGVKIHIEAGKKFKHTYTGKFRLDDGLDYGLQVLQATTSFVYQRHADRNEIRIK